MTKKGFKKIQSYIYQNKSMIKWIVFFLSKYTTSIDVDRNRIDMTLDVTDSSDWLKLSLVLQTMFAMKVKILETPNLEDWLKCA